MIDRDDVAALRWAMALMLHWRNRDMPAVRMCLDEVTDVDQARKVIMAILVTGGDDKMSFSDGTLRLVASVLAGE